MEFEWDPDKAASNLLKDGVRFTEAMSVFGDLLEAIISDLLHSAEEGRFVSIGPLGCRTLACRGLPERQGE